MGNRRLLFLAAALAIAAAAYVAVAGWPWASKPPPTAAAPAPVPEVGIVTVQPAEVPLAMEYAGRIIGLRDVEVRSRVSGLLLKQAYEDGAAVEKDQLLFQVDPAPYQVALARAEAQAAQARAALRQAEENFTRVEELVRRQVATEKQKDEALAGRDQARAALQLAEAEIANAKLNLSHTEISSPVAGVTALESPSVGSLIQAQQTLLTTVTPRDPAYVSFSFSDEDNRGFQDINARRTTPIESSDLTVKLLYANDRVYGETGRIDTAAQRVDPRTGTIQARAIFPNPQGQLLPGQFVRVRINGISLQDAIVVPKPAVGQGPQGPFVFVVGADNVIEARPIRLGREIDAGWVVSEGLKGGDRVVVDGVMRVRPGAAVKPVALAAAPAAASAAGTPAPTPGTR